MENAEKEKSKVNNDTDKTIVFMNDLKEVQRIQYDYFKHMSTLCSGLIIIIPAFVIKGPLGCIDSVFMILSLICFATCLAAAVHALPAPGNAILYIVKVSILMWHREKNKISKYEGKFDEALDQIAKHSKITKWSFLAGMLLLLISIATKILIK